MRMITLKDLWELFLNRLVLIVLGAVLASGGMFFFWKATYEPEYTSTAILYILRQNENATGDAADDFSLALKVVNDCTYLLKSHAVLDEVISSLDLNVSYRDLYSRISTTNPANTRILEVTVTDKSPDEAKRIVDTLCTIGPEKIDAVMGFEQINLFEYGTLNRNPSNGVDMASCVIVGIIAAAVVYSVFLLIFLLDDRIHSDDDLEKVFDLSILADVPDANEIHKGNYGYYKHTKKSSVKKTGKRRKEAE